MSDKRIQKVTVNCDCKNVELEILGLNQEFIVCHCQLCQLLHAGPGFGVHFNDVKILKGEEFIKKYESDKVPVAVWHFCAECGTKLYFRFYDELWKNKNDQNVLSVGVLQGNKSSKEVAGKLTMVSEAFYNDKPHYYSFNEKTDHLSTERTIQKYVEMSQASSAEWDTLRSRFLTE